MHDLLLALLFLGLMLCSALAGMALRVRLPDEHKADSSRDAVLRSVGLVVTLAALVMGFLVSSAKAYFTTVEDDLMEISSDVAALDRILLHFGPQAEPAQKLLRQLVGTAVRTVWPTYPTTLPKYEGATGLDAVERLSEAIEALPGADDRHATLRGQALGYVLAIERAGFKLKRLQEAHAQTPLLAIVLSWLVIIFMGFGLMTPRNRTTLAAMSLAAVAAAGALFLIVELYSPVTGLIMIPPSTMESAVAPIGLP